MAALDGFDDYEVEVHPRVLELHPELSLEDVQHAVKRLVQSQERPDTEPLKFIGVGLDTNGRMLQWIGFWDKYKANTFFVYHSMKATEKAYKELGMM